MAANRSFKALWRSLSFTAQLAGLTTLLVVVTIPLALTANNNPTHSQSSAATPINNTYLLPVRAPSCAPRPKCLDTKPPCMIVEPADGWCPNALPVDTVMVRPFISTTSLPRVLRNRPYTATITGSEANPQAILTLTAQNLPKGLSLTNCQPALRQTTMMINCQLTGKTNDTPGTFPVIFRLSDSHGATAIKTLNLTVSNRLW
jgi:hypothetical protein